MPFQFVELFCVFCRSSSARRVQIKDNNNLSIFYYTFQTSAVINKNKSKMLVVYHLRFLKTNPSLKMCFEFVRKILPIIPSSLAVSCSFKKCIIAASFFLMLHLTCKSIKKEKHEYIRCWCLFYQKLPLKCLLCRTQWKISD